MHLGFLLFSYSLASPPRQHKNLFLFLDLLPTHCKKKTSSLRSDDLMLLAHLLVWSNSGPAASSLRLQPDMANTFPHPAASQPREHRPQAPGRDRGVPMDKEQATRCSTLASDITFCNTKAPLLSTAGRRTLNSEHFKYGNTSRVT